MQHAAYVITSLLGKGSGGKVYKARVPNLVDGVQAYVAVKKVLVRPERTRRQMRNRRGVVQEEAENLQRLRHPNIVGHIGHYWCGDTFYIVCELGGIDLEQYQNKNGTLAVAYDDWFGATPGAYPCYGKNVFDAAGPYEFPVFDAAGPF